MQRVGLLFGGGDAAGDLVELGRGFFLPRRPLRVLRLQVGQPRLRTLAAFDDVADALLEPAHLERGLRQLALARVQRVVGGVVGLAHVFELGLGVAQLGQAGFQRGGGFGRGRLHTRLFVGGVAVLQEPQLVQLQRALFLQRAVLRGHLGLTLELVEVAVELAQDVVDAREVLARVLQPVLGFAAAFLVLGHARSLFEEEPQLLGPAFDDAADGALADDGVGPRAQARAEEDVLHVAAAHRLVVDEVAAGAVARERALDGDLGEGVPLAAGAGQRVVEHQLHAGAAGGLAVAAAVEDDVLHGLATQLGRLALAEHPAHGVHDVALAAAVGPDHAHQLPRQLEGGGFGKALEARELDLREAHRLNARRLAAAERKCLILKGKSAPERGADWAG